MVVHSLDMIRCRYSPSNIRFHDLQHLETVVFQMDLQTTPRSTCTISPSQMLYVDHSKIPRQVALLDCGSNPPQPGKNVLHTTMEDIKVGVCPQSYC